MTVYVKPDQTATQDMEEYQDAWKEVTQPILDAVPGSQLHRFGVNHTSYQVEILFDNKIMPMTVGFAQALTKALSPSEDTSESDTTPGEEHDVLF